MFDKFGRNINYIRISVTESCNLSCRYCIPEHGVCPKKNEEILTEEEIVTAARAAASLGIQKLRITGGEPLMKENILSVCERCAAVEGIQELCMTTNGTFLSKMAKDLRKAGVQRLNISLDTLNREKYAYITRGGKLERTMAGLETALQAGYDKIKINAVLIGGFNEDEIPELAELTREYPVDVRFIELMPMNDEGAFGNEAFLSYEKVLQILPQLVPVPQDGGVARLYRLPGARGNVGLISPLNAHFCGTCNRIRVTADGKLKPCLHSPDEYSIRGLRLEEMRSQMERAILAKPEWHGLLSAKNPSRAGRCMNQIGG